MTIIRPQCALLSVSDKRGIVELARALVEFGTQILSTDGTARLLIENGIEVVSVAEYTGFPELMDGRLKTLHPKIHGGILARPVVDQEEMRANDIQSIELVVVNLYPFERVAADANAARDTVIDNIDIGGPAMIRAAAKNSEHTAVIVDPNDYAAVLADIRQSDGIRHATRAELALKAFERTAQYDAAIANYLAGVTAGSVPYTDTLKLSLRKELDLRYGENPHQSAAFYGIKDDDRSWFSRSVIHQGKSLSFNNIVDIDAAYQAVSEFTEPACVIVKHATPCGVAVADDIAQAYGLAYQTDPTSAYGGIIAVNRALDEVTVAQILGNQFVEVILAPGVSTPALTYLQDKQNIRVLEHTEQYASPPPRRWVAACGGLLVQSPDISLLAGDEPKTVTQSRPTDEQREDLLFAWTVAKHVKSNAIVYAKDRRTIGIGAGQMSRVDSAKIAVLKAIDAGLNVAGAVMASDAFFPFRDGIDTAAEAGISAIIQPGGSVRDAQVIAAADEYGMAMLFTGMRHFRH